MKELLMTGCAFVGALGLLAFGGFVLMGCVHEITSWLDQRERRRWSAEREDAVRHAGLRMVSDSDWLSENKAAMLALRLYGQALREWGQADIGAVRDEWRRKREPVGTER